MKTFQIVDRTESTASGIAKKIVGAVLKQNYVQEDIEKAVNLAVQRFADKVREHARDELKYMRIKQIPRTT